LFFLLLFQAIVLQPAAFLHVSPCCFSIVLPCCLPFCALATELFLQVQKSLLHCSAAQPYNQALLLEWKGKSFELQKERHNGHFFCPFYLFISLSFSLSLSLSNMICPLSSLSQTLCPHYIHPHTSTNIHQWFSSCKCWRPCR